MIALFQVVAGSFGKTEMKVGDMVRFKRDISGLEKALGIILEKRAHLVTVKWWEHHSDIVSEDTCFLEVISESR